MRLGSPLPTSPGRAVSWDDEMLWGTKWNCLALDNMVKFPSTVTSLRSASIVRHKQARSILPLSGSVCVVTFFHLYWSHGSTQEEELLSAYVWKTLNARQIFAAEDWITIYAVAQPGAEEYFATHQTPGQTDRSERGRIDGALMLQMICTVSSMVSTSNRWPKPSKLSS